MLLEVAFQPLLMVLRVLAYDSREHLRKTRDLAKFDRTGALRHTAIHGLAGAIGNEPLVHNRVRLDADPAPGARFFEKIRIAVGHAIVRTDIDEGAVSQFTKDPAVEKQILQGERSIESEVGLSTRCT